jgi:hypothetical protein
VKNNTGITSITVGNSFTQLLDNTTKQIILDAVLVRASALLTPPKKYKAEKVLSERGGYDSKGVDKQCCRKVTTSKFRVFDVPVVCRAA